MKWRGLTYPCLIKSRPRRGAIPAWAVSTPEVLPRCSSIDPHLTLPSFLSALGCGSHFVPVCPTFPSLSSSVFAVAPLKIQFFTPLGRSPPRGEVSAPVIPACFLVCRWKTSRSRLGGLEGPDRRFRRRSLDRGGGASTGEAGPSQPFPDSLIC